MNNKASINRYIRDCLVEAIVLYMKDEIKSGDFVEKLSEYLEKELIDESIYIVCLNLLNFCDDYKEHSISVEKKEWEYLQRLIVFLKTDFEVIPLKYQFQAKGNVIFFISALVCLIVTTLISIFSNLWGILICIWILLGLIDLFICPEYSPDQNFIEKIAYAPFRTESEWKMVQPLINNLNLPQYDPAVHGKEIRSKVEEKIFLLIYGVMGFPILPIILLLRLIIPETEIIPLLKGPGEEKEAGTFI